jgi:hypothetical protein
MNERTSAAERGSKRTVGAIAAAGFVVLAVLLVVFAVTQENLVGTAAGVVAILTGIALGMWLVRSDDDGDEAVA